MWQGEGVIVKLAALAEGWIEQLVSLARCWDTRSWPKNTRGRGNSWRHEGGMSIDELLTSASALGVRMRLMNCFKLAWMIGKM